MSGAAGAGGQVAKKLWQFGLLGVPADADLLEELAAALELDACVSVDLEKGTALLAAYAGDPETAAAAGARLRTALADWAGLFSVPPVFSSTELAAADWTEVWKRYFHTFRASHRIVVKPAWEDYAVVPGDLVVEIDPGMSFGTGYHGTTQACLQFLDELRDGFGAGPAALLDAGCGSGILSIAGRKLGYSPVVAFDNDPVAARIAAENLANAGCADVQAATADLAAPGLDRRFQVVVANVLAPVLIRHASVLAGLLAPAPAYLVLSGILTKEYDQVLSCFTGLGLRECGRKTLAEWTSGCFQAPGR